MVWTPGKSMKQTLLHPCATVPCRRSCVSRSDCPWCNWFHYYFLYV